MNRLYKFLALLLFTPALCLAQQNFKSGYIINSKGDTLKGLIDYREWNKNPEEFRFRKTITENIETFSINNVLGFGINDLETYQRFTVSVSIDAVSLNNPASGIDTTQHPKTVFLKSLVKGDRVNLYAYTDDLKSRYYVSENKKAPVELNYWVYSAQDGSNIKYNRRYRSQLIFLAQQFQATSTSLPSIISNADYTESDLTNVVGKLNNTSVQSNISGKSGIQYFIGAGINYGNISFNGINNTGNYIFSGNDTKISHTPMPYISGGIDFFNNNTTRKLFLILEFSLYTDQHKVSGSNVSGGFANSTGFGSLDYHQYSLAFGPQIGYNFYNQPSLKIFASLGENINFSAYNSYKYTETNSITSTTYTADKYPAFETLWISPVVKAGITLNQKFDIYVGASLSSNIAKYTQFYVSQTGYQLGIHYFMGK